MCAYMNHIRRKRMSNFLSMCIFYVSQIRIKHMSQRLSAHIKAKISSSPILPSSIFPYHHLHAVKTTTISFTYLLPFQCSHHHIQYLLLIILTRKRMGFALSNFAVRVEPKPRCPNTFYYYTASCLYPEHHLYPDYLLISAPNHRS
jgi:hypothetical protein